MQIADTHQHLWDIDLFRYSWLDSVPQLNRSFRMAEALQALTHNAGETNQKKLFYDNAIRVYRLT
jgi:predicted TIM-barrel fold metal-dependent hydrolase